IKSLHSLCDNKKNRGQVKMLLNITCSKTKQQRKNTFGRLFLIRGGFNVRSTFDLGFSITNSCLHLFGQIAVDGRVLDQPDIFDSLQSGEAVFLYRQQFVLIRKFKFGFFGRFRLDQKHFSTLHHTLKLESISKHEKKFDSKICDFSVREVDDSK
ncbi:hypothetical protein PMAYCL1PPCAC_25207, partial [Pristionchus mayeri]